MVGILVFAVELESRHLDAQVTRSGGQRQLELLWQTLFCRVPSIKQAPTLKQQFDRLLKSSRGGRA
jgi:hypothetical protein